MIVVARLVDVIVTVPVPETNEAEAIVVLVEDEIDDSVVLVRAVVEVEICVGTVLCVVWESVLSDSSGELVVLTIITVEVGVVTEVVITIPVLEEV